MFKLTLQDIALGWFETESPTWLTEDQMKQAFLKRFNPWGDTRRQQQDAWNKLKFDMNKDDVDAFVVNMKMLASILGHDEEATREKFKDIFPDPNIEAALIAMEDFAAMQAKAKQLVQIYKPTHISSIASATLLTHTVPDAKTMPAPPQPQINQHQLAPTNPAQQEDHSSAGNDEYREIIGVEAEAETEDPAVEVEDEIPRIEMTETVEETGENISKVITIIGDKVKTVLLEDVENSGTVIMIIRIEVETDKGTVEERNGTEAKVKVMEREVEVEDGIHTNNTHPRDMPQVHIIKIHNTTDPRLWDIKPHTQ